MSIIDDNLLILNFDVTEFNDEKSNA